MASTLQKKSTPVKVTPSARKTIDDSSRKYGVSRTRVVDLMAVAWRGLTDTQRAAVFGKLAQECNEQ